VRKTFTIDLTHRTSSGLRILLWVSVFIWTALPLYSQTLPNEVEEKPSDPIARVLEAYNHGKYRNALRELEEMAVPDSNPMAPVLMEVKVQCFRLTQQPERAQNLATRFFELFPEHPLGVMVKMALGDMEVTRGNFGQGLIDYLEARTLLRPPTSPDSVDHRIIKSIPYAVPGIHIDSLKKRLPQPEIQPLLVLIHAYQVLTQGRVDDAALMLSTVDRTALPDIYQSYYDQLLLKSYQPALPTVMVGAILPMSGDPSDAGQTFIQGLTAGLTATSDAPVALQVMVMDNEGDPMKTITLCKQAFANPALDLVVGPLTETNSILVANTLSGTDLTAVLPTAVTGGLSTMGSNILQFNGDLDSRGRATARFCSQVLGLQSMAILAPADDYGQPIVNAFVDEFEYLGGEILAQEWYSGKPENLRRQFLAIRKIAWELEKEASRYDEFLGMEIDSLEGLFEISDQTFFDLPETEEKTLSPSDSNKVELNTIPGIFMPIHEEDVSYIGTQFPLYNLNTVVVGNEGWHNLDILNQEIVGPHIQGLMTLAPINEELAVDDALSQIEKNQRRFFIQGKDLAKFLIAACPDSAPDRNSIREALANLSELHVGNRTYYFSPTKPQLNQAYHVYRYDGKQFVDQGIFIEDSLRSNPRLTP